jgi:heat shock protein HtpX
MYSAIARNKRATVILIVTYISLIVALGIAMSVALKSVWPVIILSVLTAVHVLWTWFGAERACEQAMRSHNVGARDEPRFYRTVETLAIRNGMPMPRLKVQEESFINAYAMGMRPEKSVVGVTRGALNELDNTELEAVMAHEMSHIKNGDSRMNILIASLVQFMQIIVIVLILGAGTASDNNQNKDKDSRAGGAALGVFLLLVAIPFILVGFIIGPIVNAAVSRQREFLADASGVEMTRFVPGMVGLFRKLEMQEFGTTGAAKGPVLGIFYTYRRPRRGIAYLFTATHPHTYKRIERVEEMERNF